MALKRGLGKGLADLGVQELLGDINNSTVANSLAELTQLPIEYLQPGKYQPRKLIDPESLQELAASIRAQGIIQPIIVRPVGDNKYEIIAGERRWRAAQIAQLDEVPVINRDISDEAVIAVALIENIQREDLNAIEEAHAYHRLVEEFQLTHAELGETVGKSRTTVSNMLRLLTLSHEVKTMLQHGDIEMGHARALLSLSNQQQLQVANRVVEQDLSVRETEKLIRRIQNPTVKQSNSGTISADIEKLERRISEKLGAKVQVDHKQKGKGRVIINYHNLDELDGILAHMGIDAKGHF